MAHCLCRRSVDRSIGILICGPLGGDPRDFCAAAKPARAMRHRQLIAKRILADSSAAASKCGEHNIASGGLTRHAQLCSRSAHLAARLGSQEAGRLPPQPPVPELGREGLGALGRSSGAKPTPWHALWPRPRPESVALPGNGRGGAFANVNQIPVRSSSSRQPCRAPPTAGTLSQMTTSRANSISG